MVNEIHRETHRPAPASLQVAVADTLKWGTPGRVPFSVEFMPPRNDEAEQRLWSAAEFW